MLALGAFWFHNATYGLAYALLVALVVLERISGSRGSGAIPLLWRTIYGLCVVRFFVAAAVIFVASDWQGSSNSSNGDAVSFDGIMTLFRTSGHTWVVGVWTQLSTLSVVGSVWLVTNNANSSAMLGLVVALVVLKFLLPASGAGFVGDATVVALAALQWAMTQGGGAQRTHATPDSSATTTPPNHVEETTTGGGGGKGLQQQRQQQQQKLIADTPRPPYVAVIFSSLRSDSDDGDYARTAHRMVQLAADQPGFLGIESARQSLGITVSYWSSMQAVLQWKKNVEHREAQAAGRREFYKGFKVRVAMVQRDYGMRLKWE